MKHYILKYMAVFGVGCKFIFVQNSRVYRHWTGNIGCWMSDDFAGIWWARSECFEHMTMWGDMLSLNFHTLKRLSLVRFLYHFLVAKWILSDFYVLYRYCMLLYEHQRYRTHRHQVDLWCTYLHRILCTCRLQ